MVGYGALVTDSIFYGPKNKHETDSCKFCKPVDLIENPADTNEWKNRYT